MGKKEEKLKEALTFDDVLIEPAASSVLPNEVWLKTRLTKKIPLNIPLLSAAMDTVTEAETAIAIAREGGIGIIHKNMSVEQQAENVEKVKRSEFWVVSNPITVSPDSTINEVNQLEKKYGIRSFPVVEKNRLVGIVTNRDLLFEDNVWKKVKDIMTKDLITVDKKVSTEEAKEILHKNRIEKLPIVDKEGHLKGLITITDIRKTERYPLANKDENGSLRVGAAVGPKDDERVAKLIEKDVDVIVIDTSHGHSKNVIDAVRRYKKKFKNMELVAGNVATATATIELIKAGADAVKIGVGPGAICLERDTLITMGDHSVKRIEDVSVGDVVITHKNRKRTVTKKYARNYCGKICNLKVNGSPQSINITPNHPVLAITFDVDPRKILKLGSKYYFNKKKYNKGLRWIDSGKLKKGDILVVPRTTVRELKPCIFDLSEFVSDYSFDENKIWSKKIGFNPNEESYVGLTTKFNTTPRIIGNIVHGGKSIDANLNLKVDQYLTSVQYERRIEPNKINRFVELDGNLMKLFGYFVAEGYISGAENNRQLCFTFAKNEIEYQQEIIELIKNIFGYESAKVIEKKNKNACTVHVFSHIIASFFERLFPPKSKNKKIPEILLMQETSLLEQFIKGAFNGDGTIRDYRRASYKTVSSSLAFQICDILIRLGFLPSINCERKKNPNWSDIYRISVSGKQYEKFIETIYPTKDVTRDKSAKQQVWADEEYIYLTIKSINHLQKETKVYNLEVGEDNSYLANRVAVHNCTTRVVAGVGVPQITAIKECTKAADKYKIPIIADGGIKYSGDITKAIAAGASSVMIGGLFAGCEETPGKTIFLNNRKFKQYRGMGSIEAMAEGAKDRYFQSEVVERSRFIPQGIEGVVPYKGTIAEVVYQLVGGLRTGMGLAGAASIDDLRKKAKLIKITKAGLKESHPHDVTITEEAPNYSPANFEE